MLYIMVHVRYFLYALDHDAEAQHFAPDGKTKTKCYYSFSPMFYEYSMFIIYLDDPLPEASTTHLIGSITCAPVDQTYPRNFIQNKRFQTRSHEIEGLRKVCIKLEMPAW